MSRQRAAPVNWRIECLGTEKRGCGLVTLTTLPRYVIFMHCLRCKRLRRNLLVATVETQAEPAENAAQCEVASMGLSG